MKIILSIILIGALGAGFAFSLLRNQNDIGGGLAKDYMKNHWGLDYDILLFAAGHIVRCEQPQ